ncbi:MAG: L,D-transpeptidase [Fluviicoccus sp.]|uniref:L,D-transpeptidase n=1 Tax=Fluviicoccus sp. TaxID=2003552 RepID=UPI00271D9E46|nr:L,D-transpeptidase [Fluviicoccus sp.]MDO8329371.1 L,D-transpeptidase [Fluviicoccus sp.]
MELRISLADQRMELLNEEGEAVQAWSVSTAAKGAGELAGSYQTPRGRHLIRAKIGAGLPLNTVFRARRPTGEIYTPELALAHPGRDWILTRILWLSGLEPGHNRLANRDTMRRYIYIHGTPDTEPMGVPASHGCIRMRNADLADLFDRVPVYTTVLIVES